MKSLAFRPDHQNGGTPTVGKKMPVRFFGGQGLAHLIGVARTLEMPLEGRCTPRSRHFEWAWRIDWAPDDLMERAHELGTRYAAGTGQHRGAEIDHTGPAGCAALQKWGDMQRAVIGKSAFLTDLLPWILGGMVQLNAGRDSYRTGESQRMDGLGEQ
jgi:enoyl-CoA hydratase/carnithine racemase